MLDQYAVFGHPISHSKSPRIHRLFAEQTGQKLEYRAHDVPAESFRQTLDSFFANGGKGLNCTVPLKELAWQFSDKLSERARLGKAVNTLTMQANGKLFGDNTDGIGLVVDLTKNHALSLLGSRILILGAGGATRGILAPILDQRPDCIVIANRTVSKAQLIVDEFSSLGPVTSCGYHELQNLQFDLILNATSASLSNQLPPLPENLLTDQGCCYDLAYSNEPTPFVRWGVSQHARHSLDGLGMLVEQAAEAFALWRNVRPQTMPVIELLDSERKNVNTITKN
jgi:shikimate dehydrogenase